VLVTRADPTLPLHRYRLAETLAEVRMSDLAFTASEAAELLTRKGVDLRPETADIITNRTQGWAAGLVMTAMSLAHQADPESAAHEFSGDTGPVAEYLLAEVLDAQPAPARTLLLSTSIVTTLRPGLVEVLAGPRAQRALTFLARGNAFLEELPGSPGCYRYHPLFRDLLRAQLWYESPQIALELHRAAARWMAENGLLADAVRHAAAGGAWADAARYLVEDLAIAQVLVELPPRSLGGAFAGLPDDVDGVAVGLVRGGLALVAEDLDAFDLAITDVRGRASAGSPATRLSLHLLLLARAGATADNVAAMQAAEEIERLLPHVDPARLERHPEILALLGANKGTALLLSGRLEEAAEVLGLGASVAAHAGCDCPRIDCLGHLALLAAFTGRLRRAVVLAEQAIELTNDAGGGRQTCPSAAETALAWVHNEACDLPRTRHHLQLAEDAVPPSADPMQDTARAIIAARVSRAVGDLDDALSRLAKAQQDPALPSWLADRVRLEEAATEIRAGEPVRALHVLQTVVDPSAPEAALGLAQARLAHGEDLAHPVPTPGAQRGSVAARVDGWLLEAWRRLRRGEESGATRALERSLRLAAPEHIRRPFREAPRDVRQLLRRHGDLTAEHGWLGPDLAGRVATVPAQRKPPSTDANPEIVVEPLTAREHEVLGHLADLLTTEEIAGVMFVSVNTVRTHVRNILRKLSATRRNEAVRRARDLGLLSG
jgi:LuxR family maltose regulon positive regulatory protein